MRTHEILLTGYLVGENSYSDDYFVRRFIEESGLCSVHLNSESVNRILSSYQAVLQNSENEVVLTIDQDIFALQGGINQKVIVNKNGALSFQVEIDNVVLALDNDVGCDVLYKADRATCNLDDCPYRQVFISGSLKEAIKISRLIQNESDDIFSKEWTFAVIDTRNVIYCAHEAYAIPSTTHAITTNGEIFKVFGNVMALNNDSPMPSEHSL